MTIPCRAGGVPMSPMTVQWRCQNCDETGQGDRDAEKHVIDTKHSVLTFIRRAA